MSDRLAVNFAGLTFDNPVTTASGTFGSGLEYSEFVRLDRLGAVTTKGVANVPWAGNPTPALRKPIAVCSMQSDCKIPVLMF